MIIAIGVGTGVGLNAILSKSLGENDKEKVNKIAGNGIFLSICIYIIFLLFGLFCSEWFISLFTSDKEIIAMGTIYLKICTCFSLGSIGYTVYERFLQATGKMMLSTIFQISGVVTNIVLDCIFIYPLNIGVVGAAWATIIGQFISLFILKDSYNMKIKVIKNDIFQDKTSLQFDFIYSVAVIHMFLLEEHRDKFYRFIYEHLKDKGKALVISMGDGERKYASDIDEASMIVQRKNINTGKMIQVVNTSCRIKKYSEMEEEIVRNGFRIVEGFIVSDVPGFDKCMSFLIEKV